MREVAVHRTDKMREVRAIVVDALTRAMQEPIRSMAENKNRHLARCAVLHLLSRLPSL